MSRTCKRVVYKKVKRSCKNALVGGAGFFTNNNEAVKVAVNAFTGAIAKLIPVKEQQHKIEASKYYSPITITNFEFPQNIILYAFIIFYCAVVHNFKIEPTPDNKALIDKNNLIVLLITALIENLKIRNDTANMLLNTLDIDYYFKVNQFKYIEEHYYDIFNAMINNKLSNDTLYREMQLTNKNLVIYANNEYESDKTKEINLSAYEENSQERITDHTYVNYVRLKTTVRAAIFDILGYLGMYCKISKIEIKIPKPHQPEP